MRLHPQAEGRRHEADPWLRAVPAQPRIADGLLNTLNIHNQIPANVPPSFIVCAGSGDQGHAVWATGYFTPMLKAAVPNLEMHIYGRGGHGGAISPRGGIPFGAWQDRFIEWFRDLGFLEPPGIETKAAREVATYAKKRAK